MVLGLYTTLYSGVPFHDVMKICSDLDLRAIELTTVDYPNKAHIDIRTLLSDDGAVSRLKETLNRNNLFISALGCSGNHVHPMDDIRIPFQSLFRNTILLAEKLGIQRIITFSGCPGDSVHSKYPNWVTCPWPDDFLKILDFQWNEVLLPYWESTSRFAMEHGVDKICIEMHPGFCVYNPETFLRLRGAAGNCIGLNFDPSHLFWQGMDPVEVIQNEGESIYHVHAKDVYLNKKQIRANGVLDAKHYKKVAARAWTFRTAGYGHSMETWKEIISALRTVGYDYVLSIEHEDMLMSREEGLNKAVGFLRQSLIENQAEGIWWA